MPICQRTFLANKGKCFTYLTKTRANSTTYSRKPGNFNGTISFEIDIMKNSSPINLNLGQTWLFHICFGCFFCFDLLWRWAESPVSPAEKKCYFGFDMAKIVNFKLSGDDFFVMSISKIMVPLQSPGFLQYVDEFAIVLTTFVKRLLLWYNRKYHILSGFPRKPEKSQKFVKEGSSDFTNDSKP